MAGVGMIIKLKNENIKNLNRLILVIRDS